MVSIAFTSAVLLTPTFAAQTDNLSPEHTGEFVCRFVQLADVLTVGHRPYAHINDFRTLADLLEGANHEL